MVVTFFAMIMAFMVMFVTMPFVGVGVFFSRMVVPFVVVIVAFVAMTRIA